MREGGEEESLPSWSLCGMAVATSQYRTRGPGRAGPATMLGQGQPLASVMIWLPGSPHHLHAGDPGHWLWVQITECVLGGCLRAGDSSREAPRETHSSFLLSLEPQEAGHHFPATPPSGSGSARLHLCL